MLNDKVYLWMVIISCLALVIAGTFAMIELRELQDPNFVGSTPVFAPK